MHDICMFVQNFIKLSAAVKVIVVTKINQATMLKTMLSCRLLSLQRTVKMLVFRKCFTKLSSY